MDRAQKKEWVSALHQVFEGANSVIVTQYSGLTVAEITDLRNKMRAAGASFKVTKNRLTRLALAGTKHEELSDFFVGPTAIAYSTDAVAAAKVCADFGKTNEKLVLIGGSLDGDVLSVDRVKALAALPSLDELRAKILGMLQTPASRIASVLQAPGGQVARVLSAKAAQGEAA